VELLTGLLAELPGIRPFVNRAEQTRPGYYKLGLQLDADRFGLDRESVAAAARAEGLALDEGFRALHVGRSASRFRSAGSRATAGRTRSRRTGDGVAS